MAAPDTTAPTASPTAPTMPAPPVAGTSYVSAEPRATPAPATSTSPLPASARPPMKRGWIIAAIAIATAAVLCGVFVSGVFLGLVVNGGVGTTQQEQQFPGQPGGPGFGGNR
jgi:hypothetical protein